MTHAQGFINQGFIELSHLIAGEFPRIKRMVTIISKQELTEGAVLGCIEASGKYVLSEAEAKDGSQLLDAILAAPLEKKTGEQQGIVYLIGEFNESALSFGSGHSIESLRMSLRLKSIFLRQNQQ
ncbi:head decoration protein [Bartonella sp. DGB2]|uniref:head decoration protein n=1 Tax=Bartonella sp. DGB2 TaxID=3388426 RepID=UPI003990347B